MAVALAGASLLPLQATSVNFNMPSDEEFVGPFASWSNVKTTFGAKGDGVTDDTAALQNALDSLQYATENHTPHVLYLPPAPTSSAIR